jgi:hypothetical protein
MSATEIEKRLTAVEQELARLRAERQPGVKPHPIHALENIHGTFENDGAFREAARLGRKWRKSQSHSVRKPMVKRK